MMMFSLSVCNEPYPPSNSDIMISDNGYTVNYRCHLGYSLSGLPSRQCQRHGTGWDGDDPLCGKSSNITKTLMHEWKIA